MSINDKIVTMSSAFAPPPLRIFVVENHSDTLKWIRLYLEEFGHIVQTAQSLAEALAHFPDSRSQVLMSDIGLPDGTGWELMERLQPSAQIFAIAMSGFGLNADSSRSRAAGFHHHLLKPFKPAELERLLKEAAKVVAIDEPLIGRPSSGL